MSVGESILSLMCSPISSALTNSGWQAGLYQAPLHPLLWEPGPLIVGFLVTPATVQAAGTQLSAASS